MELPADGAEPVAEADADSNALDVRSTLVGYYRAVGKPGAKPPEVGDKVKAGQIIGAVEALRVLNEVESPSAGRIRAILVGDGQPIEYGQVLMKVEPLEV
jgi:biotin carboxyl carrier protein